MSNPSMAEERSLVSRVIGGDADAFRVLISQNERLVAHMVGRLVKRAEDREEVCQDVFLKVYQKLGEFSFESKLSTWIATIAYRHAINHIRKHKMDFEELPEGDLEHSRFKEVEDPEAILSESDIETHVMKLVELLPVQYRTVLTLYHLDGMNYSEIAKVTDMPDGTVKSYLFRARTLLKEKVKRYLGKEELK